MLEDRRRPLAAWSAAALALLALAFSLAGDGTGPFGFEALRAPAWTIVVLLAIVAASLYALRPASRAPAPVAPPARES